MNQEKTFRYNKKIDKQITVASAKVLGVLVKRAIKMKHGEVNHVYKVVTDNGNFLVRIFQYRTWPEEGKLKWIEKQLSKHKIPHAKILYYSRSHEFFKFGFMVTEFLEGPNGNQAEKLRKISLSRAFYETGKILKKVHSIKIKKFGSVPSMGISTPGFVEYKLNSMKSKIGFLERLKAIKPGLYPRIAQNVKQTLLTFNKGFYPVLVHNDANRENAILTPDRGWILVDWDNAYAGAWLEDYADLTYWVNWDRKPTHAKQVHAIIKKNFFKGHGLGGFNLQQIEKIELALHLMKAINMMIYYFNFKHSPKEFRKTKRKLLKLLNNGKV